MLFTNSGTSNPRSSLSYRDTSEPVGGVSDMGALDAKKVRAPSSSQEDARVRTREKLCWTYRAPPNVKLTPAE